MACKDIMEEVLNLLYWTMLAATTVGPGTVVTCARAGAEYELHLIWALIFASVLAYALQEGTARLTIVSGRSLGECLQVKYSHGRKLWDVGIFCWFIIGCVFVGNTLYECNCFAGGMAAIYSLPPAENTLILRISCCVVYAIIVNVLLLADKTHILGIGLGIVTISMVTLFLVVVIKLGLDVTRFAKGLIPISMPDGSANIVLSLISTTSLGFNLFLGGEMAKGKSLQGAQRGIAFSTFIAFSISLLILIVGDGTHRRSNGIFTIESLTDIIHRICGDTGIWIFAIGFIAAALSSMLTVPLGAAITAESILSINCSQGEQKVETLGNCTYSNDTIPNNNRPNEKEKTTCTEFIVVSPQKPSRPLPRKYYKGIMFVMVTISMAVIAANAPTVPVILIAQVFNGCLLPLFSICLLICINEEQFMGKSPQKGWSNCILIVVVSITLFLTASTIIQNAFGWAVTMQYTTASTMQLCNFIISGICSLFTMYMLLHLTQLGDNIGKSFLIFFRREKEGNLELVNYTRRMGGQD